jgi:hypothetical protein
MPPVTQAGEPAKPFQIIKPEDYPEVVLYSVNLQPKASIRPPISLDGLDALIYQNELYIKKDDKYVEASYFMHLTDI